MKATKEQMAVMKAYMDGEDIECHYEGGWGDVAGEPAWTWGVYEYRVKRKPETIFVNMYEHGYGRPHKTSDKARDQASDNAIRTAIEFKEVIK